MQARRAHGHRRAIGVGHRRTGAHQAPPRTIELLPGALAEALAEVAEAPCSGAHRSSGRREQPGQHAPQSLADKPQPVAILAQRLRQRHRRRQKRRAQLGHDVHEARGGHLRVHRHERMPALQAAQETGHHERCLVPQHHDRLAVVRSRGQLRGDGVRQLPQLPVRHRRPIGRAEGRRLRTRPHRLLNRLQESVLLCHLPPPRLSRRGCSPAAFLKRADQR